MPHADGLYHERHGAGEPLLLITGWTISAAVVEPVLDLYAEHFECIVYDHRGSARSGGSPPATMAALADDAATLLSALRVPRAHVYGLSMGGMVAQELALRHPARVRGLALGGTSPGGLLAPRLGPRGVLAIARGSLAERSIRAPLLFSPTFRREHPERVQRRASPRPSSPSCPAPGTPTPSTPHASRSSCCSRGWSAGRPNPVRERKPHVAPDR